MRLRTTDNDGDCATITTWDNWEERWTTEVITPDAYIMESISHNIFMAERQELDSSIPAMGAVSYTNHCNEEKGNTMATIVSKKDLKFKDGFLSLGDGTIVSPGFVDSYNKLEHYLQRAAYHNKNMGDVVEAFVPKTNFGTRLIEVPEPETPLMDADAERADALSEEGRLIRAKQDAEEVLDAFNSVVEFVCGGTVVLYDGDYHATIIDTPVLGDPLKLTKDKLLKLVCEAVEYPLG